MIRIFTNEKEGIFKGTIVLSAAVLSIGLLTGCGSSSSTEGAVGETVQEAATETAEADAVSNDASDEVSKEESVTTPYLEDLEKYESIISTLTTEQYYAFAGIGEDYDVLLVADGVFDNGDGTMAAIDARVYGFGNDGLLYEAGNVWSDGTAYPLAVYENCIMFGGNHNMAMASVIDGSVVIKMEASETFDEDGNVTYSYNDGNIDNEQTVNDDSVLKEMYEKYENATVINFTPGEAEFVPDPPLGDYPSNDFEDRVKKTSFKSYDEIISLLEGDEAYAYADVKGYDGKVLLVATYTFDDQLGHIATVKMTPYTMKGDEVTADSIMFSGGTADPISIDEDGVIFCVTHNDINKLCYGDNGTDIRGIMCLAYVHAEEIGDKGEPKRLTGFVRTENTVIDNDGEDVGENDTDVWYELMDEYKKTEPISFTRVSE